MEETTTVPTGVRRRPAAGAGVVGAALALVGATLSWPGEPLVPVGSFGSPVGVALATVALATFLARRWDAVGPGVAGPVGVGAGTGLAAVATVRLVAPATSGGVPPTIGLGLWTTMVAGIACAGLAVAEYRGAGAEDLTAMGIGIALAFGLTIAGFVVQILLTLPLGLGVGAVADGTYAEVLSQVLSPLTLVGFVLVGVAFVASTDRGVGWLDVSKPSLTDLGYVVAGVFALLGVQVVVALVTVSLDVPTSENVIVRVAETAVDEGYAWAVLLMVPLQLLVVGPAEELLFRGVIQKYLYGPFSRSGAVVATSLVFASAHVVSYWDENPAALFVSLAAVFALALVLGAIYERTENLVVPALVHGAFNGILVLLLYLSVTGDTSSAAMLVP